MRIHRGPAAVIGDERRCNAIRGVVCCRHGNERRCGEGAVSSLIRKPENLPVIAVGERWRLRGRGAAISDGMKSAASAVLHSGA